MFKKSILVIGMLGLLSSSVVASDAVSEDVYYAHFDKKTEELIEVNFDNKKMHKDDEIVAITDEWIGSYDRVLLAAKSKEWKPGKGDNDMSAGFVWCSSNPHEDTLINNEKQNLEICDSMFMTWNGQAFSLLTNTVIGYGVLANATFAAIDTVGAVFSLGYRYPFKDGWGYFAQYDTSKLNEFIEKYDLTSYQLKLKAK